MTFSISGIFSSRFVVLHFFYLDVYLVRNLFSLFFSIHNKYSKGLFSSFDHLSQMSTQKYNKESGLDNLSESDANQSSTSGITGGSTGAIGSGKGKEGSTTLGSYDTSSNNNNQSGKQIDSFDGAIPGTKTEKNKDKS